MNALKTGIHAKSLVLPSEKVADLEQLIDEFYQSHQPTTPDARSFVDDLIRCEWTLRRLDTAETQMWLYQNDDKFRTPQKYPLGYSASCNSTPFSKPPPPPPPPPPPSPKPPPPATIPVAESLA